MSERSLTREVVHFLRDHIHSVEQLEILLLLRKEAPRAMTAHDVARELRTNEASVATRTAELLASQLVSRVGEGPASAYRYEPGTPETARAADAVANAYAAMRYRVIEQILSRPMDKVRLFANAFRVRKEEDDDG